MEGASAYLLVLGCSARKRTDPGVLPAIERYDGVNFRVLRKLMREGRWPGNVDVLIISAKYGVLSPLTPIEYYDQPMTRDRAVALQRQVGACLDVRMGQVPYSELFINLGQTYRLALGCCQRIQCAGVRVQYATGGIGQRMAQMKDWLISLHTAS